MKLNWMTKRRSSVRESMPVVVGMGVYGEERMQKLAWEKPHSLMIL